MELKQELEDPLKDFSRELHNMKIKQIFPHHPFHILRVIVLVFIFGLVAAVAGTAGFMLGRSEIPQSHYETQPLPVAQPASPAGRPASP